MVSLTTHLIFLVEFGLSQQARLSHPSRWGPKLSPMGFRDLRALLSRLKIPAVHRKRYKLEFLPKIYATFCLFFAFAVISQAQVTVSANLTDGTCATYRTVYLHFQLLNCGDNFPAVPSAPSLLVQDSFDIHPSLTTGLVTGTIIGNDQILCGNVASTWYQVTSVDC